MDARYSVAMNAYNRESEIGETLESVLGQSLAPHEVVVVDDGSTDRTADVVKSFGARASYHRIDNAGPGLSRHAAVQRCSSPWIAVCDSDDIWEKSHLRSLSKTRGEFPKSVLVFTNSTRFGAPGSEGYDHFEAIPNDWWSGAILTRRGNYIRLHGDAYLHLLSYNPVYPSCLSFDAKVYASIGGVHPPFSRLSNEDSDLTRRLTLAGPVACNRKISVRIRKHPGNFSADNTRNLIGKFHILDHHVRELELPDSHVRAASEERDRTLLSAFRCAYWDGDIASAQWCLERMPTYLKGWTWRDRLRMPLLKYRQRSATR